MNKNNSFTVISDISKLKEVSEAFTEYVQLITKMEDILEVIIRKIYEEKYLKKFHLFKKSVDEFGSHHESYAYNNRYNHRRFENYNLDTEIINFFKYTYNIKPMYYAPIDFFNQLKYCVQNGYGINISTSHNRWVETIISDVEKLKKEIKNIETYLEK